MCRWRFSNNQESFADSGVVGLGGGVEISFDIRSARRENDVVLDCCSCAIMVPLQVLQEDGNAHRVLRGL